MSCSTVHRQQLNRSPFQDHNLETMVDACFWTPVFISTLQAEVSITA